MIHYGWKTSTVFSLAEHVLQPSGSITCGARTEEERQSDLDEAGEMVPLGDTATAASKANSTADQDKANCRTVRTFGFPDLPQTCDISKVYTVRCFDNQQPSTLIAHADQQ